MRPIIGVYRQGLLVVLLCDEALSVKFGGELNQKPASISEVLDLLLIQNHNLWREIRKIY